MSGYNSKKRKARGTQGRGNGTTSGVRDPYAHSGTGIPGISRTGTRSYETITDFSGLNSLGITRQQNDMGSTYDQMLNHNAGDNSFAGLLAGLGIHQEQGLSGSQRDDWNKQLLDAMLQYYITQEQRQYNEGALAEQRLYDNPQNALARLMGAGISRDAAIQLLSSGSGSGSGSGSALISDPNVAAQGLPASQSQLNGIQAITSVVGSVAQVAGAIGSLGQFGISAASLATNLAATKAATAGQLLSNQQFSKTLQGIETASTVIGAISSAVDAGVVDKDHTFSSAQDMVQYINDNASRYEPFQALVDSGTMSGIMRDVYSLNALNAGYKSWRESKDYNIDRNHLVKMQSLERQLASLDIDKASSEIALNNQYIAESIQKVVNDNLRVSNETALNVAQLDLLGQQTDALRYENVSARLDAEWYEANINDINYVRLQEIALQAAEWQELVNNPKAYKDAVETFLLNKENARTAAALECLYLDEEYDTQTKMNGTEARKTALYWHNLFNFALGVPKPSESELNSLGKFAKSAAMMFLFKRP